MRRVRNGVDVGLDAIKSIVNRRVELSFAVFYKMLVNIGCKDVARGCHDKVDKNPVRGTWHLCIFGKDIRIVVLVDIDAATVTCISIIAVSQEYLEAMTQITIKSAAYFFEIGIDGFLLASKGCIGTVVPVPAGTAVIYFCVFQV